MVQILAFDSRQDTFLLYSGSVAESVGTRMSTIQPSSVDEVQECWTCIAIKVRRRKPERHGKILNFISRKKLVGENRGEMKRSLT